MGSLQRDVGRGQSPGSDQLDQPTALACVGIDGEQEEVRLVGFIEVGPWTSELIRPLVSTPSLST